MRTDGSDPAEAAGRRPLGGGIPTPEYVALAAPEYVAQPRTKAAVTMSGLQQSTRATQGQAQIAGTDKQGQHGPPT